MLQQLGVGDLFDSTADLSGLAPQGYVHLDDAVHKAKIEVDEQGNSSCIEFRSIILSLKINFKYSKFNFLLFY